MKKLQLGIQNTDSYFPSEIYNNFYKKSAEICKSIIDASEDKDVKGWLTPTLPQNIDSILEKANEVRQNADVFILIGVGGSNQGARAVIKSFDKKDSPKIIYAGNTLSSYSLQKILDDIKGKSIYCNIIAKNFETLEPGSHFRVIRNIMCKIYGKEDLSKRIIVTGTKDSQLHKIAIENNYTFFDFPIDIGGRFSVHSPVGLFPMAVAGIDIKSLQKGIYDMSTQIDNERENSIAVKYAITRNSLYDSGYNIEVLAAFEPRFAYFMKWWIQLFGESEGKSGKGIFPSSVIYSEDLHSMGQYMQQGRRNILETFIKVEDSGASVIFPKNTDFDDGFDYINNMDFEEINKIAQSATIDAHKAGDVPCMTISLPKLDEYYFGQLFYFFEFACAVSGKLLGVNPFDQDGVEAYKNGMFKFLKK